MVFFHLHFYTVRISSLYKSGAGGIYTCCGDVFSAEHGTWSRALVLSCLVLGRDLQLECWAKWGSARGQHCAGNGVAELSLALNESTILVGSKVFHSGMVCGTNEPKSVTVAPDSPEFAVVGCFGMRICLLLVVLSRYSSYESIYHLIK